VDFTGALWLVVAFLAIVRLVTSKVSGSNRSIVMRFRLIVDRKRKEYGGIANNKNRGRKNQ
jgi:hypothetical protein